MLTKNPGPITAMPRRKGPIRELREDHFRVSQADMCQAMQVSPTLLAATEKGVYKRVPPAIVEGLKALGQDAARICEEYDQWYKEICLQRLAQLLGDGL